MAELYPMKLVATKKNADSSRYHSFAWLSRRSRCILALSEYLLGRPPLKPCKLHGTYFRVMRRVADFQWIPKLRHISLRISPLRALFAFLYCFHRCSRYSLIAWADTRETSWILWFSWSKTIIPCPGTSCNIFSVLFLSAESLWSKSPSVTLLMSGLVFFLKKPY